MAVATVRSPLPATWSPEEGEDKHAVEFAISRLSSLAETIEEMRQAVRVQPPHCPPDLSTASGLCCARSRPCSFLSCPGRQLAVQIAARSARAANDSPPTHPQVHTHSQSTLGVGGDADVDDYDSDESF